MLGGQGQGLRKAGPCKTSGMGQCENYTTITGHPDNRAAKNFMLAGAGLLGRFAFCSWLEATKFLQDIAAALGAVLFWRGHSLPWEAEASKGACVCCFPRSGPTAGSASPHRRRFRPVGKTSYGLRSA